MIFIFENGAYKVKWFKLLPSSNQEDRRLAQDRLQWPIQLFLLAQKYQQSCHDMHMIEQLLNRPLHNLNNFTHLPYPLIEGLYYKATYYSNIRL